MLLEVKLPISLACTFGRKSSHTGEEPGYRAHLAVHMNVDTSSPVAKTLSECTYNVVARGLLH